MNKIIIAAQLNRDVFDEAQQLIAAGHFANLDELLDAALRTFVLQYEPAQQHTAESLAARAVQGLMADFDELEREQFEEFVAAYVGVAQRAINDDDVVSLLEIFKAYGVKRALAAVHDVQDSKVPLSPRYLETMLERTSREGERGTRVRVDENNAVLAVVARMYEQEIGELTEKISQQLIALVGEFPDLERWHEAFDAAASMNKKNLRYVIGCLKNNGQKTEQKGKTKRGVSQSERHRQEKRTRYQEYDDYWSERLKAQQQPKER